MRKRAVWKYPMGEWTTGMFSTEMPVGAEVLSLEWQHDDLCMWALVNPDAPKEQRHFVVVGTGHEYTSPNHQGAALTREGYVGMFQYAGGDLIFHVFEVFRAAR